MIASCSSRPSSGPMSRCIALSVVVVRVGAAGRGRHADKALDPLFLQVDEKQGDGRGRDARDSGGLSQGLRTMLAKLLAHFEGKRSDLAVVEIRRKRQALE